MTKPGSEEDKKWMTCIPTDSVVHMSELSSSAVAFIYCSGVGLVRIELLFAPKNSLPPSFSLDPPPTTKSHHTTRLSTATVL